MPPSLGSGPLIRMRSRDCSVRCWRSVPGPGCCGRVWLLSTAPSWPPTHPGTRTAARLSSPRKSLPRPKPPIAPRMLPPVRSPPVARGQQMTPRGARRQARPRELLEELQAEAEQKSYEAHMAKRAEIEAATGRPIRGRGPSPSAVTHKSRAQANVSDPDSRLLKTKEGYVQGYNAQAVATVEQFVLAAEATNLAHDAPAFGPLIIAAKKNLRTAGEKRRVRRVVADAGYWSIENVNTTGVESFIAPGRARELKRIAEADNDRSALLDKVAAGQLDTAQAAEQLGVTRARVNQLLRRRRTGDPDPLTTTMMAKLDTHAGDVPTTSERQPSSRCSRRSSTIARSAASPGGDPPPRTASGS